MDDGDCEPCGCEETGSSSQSSGSFHWKLNTGKARFLNTSSLLQLSQVQPRALQATVLGGKVPGSRNSFLDQQMTRSFSNTGRAPVWLTIDVPTLDPASFTYDPSILKVSGSHATVIRGGAGLRQILTEDAFTDISVVDAKTFRVRLWSRAAWKPVKTGSGSRYWTLPVGITPTSDTVFTNPDSTPLGRLQVTTTRLVGSSSRTDTVLYAQSSSPDRLITEEYTGSSILPAKLLRRTTLTYSARVAGRPWSYTLDRQVEEATSLNGVNGLPVVVAQVREVYQDFSISAAGGEPKGSRLMSTTAGYGSPAPRTSTFTYYSDPSNPKLHGRLETRVNPDGSWEFNTYNFGTSVSVLTR